MAPASVVPMVASLGDAGLPSDDAGARLHRVAVSRVAPAERGQQIIRRAKRATEVIVGKIATTPESVATASVNAPSKARRELGQVIRWNAGG